MIDGQTHAHTHTHAGNDNTRRPKLASGKKSLHFGTQVILGYICRRYCKPASHFIGHAHNNPTIHFPVLCIHETIFQNKAFAFSSDGAFAVLINSSRRFLVLPWTAWETDISIHWIWTYWPNNLFWYFGIHGVIVQGRTLEFGAIGAHNMLIKVCPGFCDDIKAIWLCFCPWCAVGAVWFHLAWLFRLMLVPTESVFYSHYVCSYRYKKIVMQIMTNSGFVSIYNLQHWFEDLHYVALMNIVETQSSMVALDKNVGWKWFTLDQ